MIVPIYSFDFLPTIKFFIGRIQSDRVWIGGTDKRIEGVWEWSDGSPWDYENWRKPTEPNNYGGNEDCIILFGSRKWFDAKCDNSFIGGYVCSFYLNGKIFWNVFSMIYATF